MAGSSLHILDRNRSGSAIGDQRRDAQEARRQTRRAGRTGLVSREIDRDRTESRRGQCSRSQRAVREALLRAGAQWWVCRSADAAMWALASRA